MKKKLLSIIIVFPVIFSYGQTGFGFDIGFATSKAPMASIIYFKDKNAFSIGVSYELNNALGKKLSKPTSAFIIGNGNYFLTADVGYTRILNENFSVEGEVSVGGKKYYTSYSDNTFPQGGYHIINKTKTIFGLGAIIIYNINDTFGVFGGYNSIREASLGVQIKFVQ